MVNFLDEVEAFFGKSNLYEALNISKTAKDAEIKKAYYKLSMLVHPDKASEDERDRATKKFQALGKIYSILSDVNLRAVYDETGTIDEDDGSSINEERDWLVYWRNLFPKIKTEDIETFAQSYKGSEEEKQDLVRLYKEYKGDMKEIMSHLMCSTMDDEPRYQEVIAGLVDAGELDDFEAFSNEAPKKKKARVAKAKKEAKEAEQLLKKLKSDNKIADGEDSLRSLIAKNQSQRSNDFLDRLEGKYAKKTPVKRKAKTASKAKE